MHKFIFTILFILLLQVLTLFGQTSENDCSAIKYQNSNVLQLEALEVNKISGSVLSEIEDSAPLLRSGICVGLFNEETKELIKTLQTRKKGRFSFKGIKNGRYRLIIIDDLFFKCPASILVEVKDRTAKSEKIVVHMIPKGTIDKCSYGELVKN